MVALAVVVELPWASVSSSFARAWANGWARAMMAPTKAAPRIRDRHRHIYAAGVALAVAVADTGRLGIETRP